MKIVINSTFGKFELSREGYERIGQLIGRKAYFYFADHTDPAFQPYKLIRTEPPYPFHRAFSEPSEEILNKMMRAGQNPYNFTEEEKKDLEDYYQATNIPNFVNDRINPILIQVIEELGEDASGDYCELKVIEIPDDIEYEFVVEDGKEYVAEKHRKWM